jgi:hypothetical protein
MFGGKKPQNYCIMNGICIPFYILSVLWDLNQFKMVNKGLSSLTIPSLEDRRGSIGNAYNA